MTHIGVFRRDDFDPGAYVVALFHAQAALAGTAHRLSLHTFPAGGLAAVAEAATDVDALLTFGPEGTDLDYLRGAARPSVVCERIVEGCSYIAPDNHDIRAHRRRAPALAGAHRACRRAAGIAGRSQRLPCVPGAGLSGGHLGGRPAGRRG